MSTFITLEGIDRSGKSTQISLLAAYLRQTGMRVRITGEPGGTQLGTHLKQLLLEGEHVNAQVELLLYLADRCHHVEHIIRPALTAGEVVICDRYTDATTAYQGYGRGLDIALIEQWNRLVTGGLEPTVTFLLDLPARVAARRSGRADRIEREHEQFHRRVRDGYKELAVKNPHRFVLIDATEPAAWIHEQIKKVLDRRTALLE